MPSNEYMREWRTTPSGKVALELQRRRQKARNRALAELARRHASEFDLLFIMHLANVEREEQDREVDVSSPVRDA